MRATATYVPWLWLFSVLLLLRVIGQIIVVLRAPRWLPPMEQWQSGLLPYPVLLLGQAIVLTLMFWICLTSGSRVDVVASALIETGGFRLQAEDRPRDSAIYLAVIRASCAMFRRPPRVS